MPRTAIVTGSTSGIGLGIATSLADAGYNIVLNGFGDPAVIEAIKAELSAKGVGVAFSPADMRQPAEIRGMVQLAVDTFGSVDVLVNNAGIQHTAPTDEFPDEQWDAIIAINMSSAFHATKAALPYMKKNGWGRVIHIASTHGLVGSANKIAYVAAKHGVVGMAKVTAIEAADFGVTVNAICPGWVLTPLVRKQIEARALANGSSFEDEAARLVGEKQPLKQFSTPEIIGGYVVFLCSEAARTTTGTSVAVDGGWTAQ